MSRSKTPNPSQDGNNYDQNLLVDAPEASRAQLREGYDVDLLESRQPQRSPSVRISPMGAATPAPPPPVPQVPLVLAGAGNGSKEQFVGAYASKPPTGFWRSRNGIITAIVIILVVIGAVVGGAVGATTKKTLSHSSAAPDDGTAPVASATSTTGSSTSASSSVHPPPSRQSAQ